MSKNGIVLKRPRPKEGQERIEKFIPALLREASMDAEGFYLKIDARDEQFYIFLGIIDVGRVVSEWGQCLAEALFRKGHI